MKVEEAQKDQSTSQSNQKKEKEVSEITDRLRGSRDARFSSPFLVPKNRAQKRWRWRAMKTSKK